MSSGPLGQESGDPVKCTPQIAIVPVAGRVGNSLVSGSVNERLTSLSFKLGTGKSGLPGFPLDQLIAGKSFTLSLKGSTRNLPVTKDDLKNKKQTTVTDGTLRVVFTPRARATASLRKPAAKQAASCAKTYPAWWSTGKRACFSLRETRAGNCEMRGHRTRRAHRARAPI